VRLVLGCDAPRGAQARDHGGDGANGGGHTSQSVRLAHNRLAVR
jgi:hypothetical protein